MRSPRDSDRPAGQPSELDLVVSEVVGEAHINADALRPEEREYLKDHALKKPMGVLHVWALGVGAVISGEYFGWNPGLKEGGPIGMLIASLFVCGLYLMWVLALTELSVAMPFAGGPLAYGRRAVGPGLGFVMGWSMFLEALFAAIGIAIATGGYAYYVLSLFADGLDEKLITTVAALATVAIFAIAQWLGSRFQSRIMEWLTYGALVGLVWFWIACIPGVRIERILTQPLLTNGWAGVLRAIPYAIWWLVMIEAVALAPEEAREPHRTIPRGLTLAQVTLIGLVLLTWFFVAGTGEDFIRTAGENIPLPFVYGQVWPKSAHLIAFTAAASIGLIASYHGIIYAVSRQSFALGRAGYLPRFLGHVHPARRTPDVSIIVWSLVIGAFVVLGYFNNDAVQVAVLTCNLTALVWYALAMVCLFILRRRDPHMPRPYKVPLYPLLPGAVLVMSVFAAAVYGWLNQPVVLWLTVFMYALGLLYHVAFARRHLIGAAPEELAARAGHEMV